MISRVVRWQSGCALVLGLCFYLGFFVGSEQRLALAAVQAQPDVCRELVANGGFEAAGADWSLLPGEYLPRYVRSVTYDRSDFALRLGALNQLNIEATSVAEQTIALPLASELVLSFYYYPVYQGTPTTGDTQTVELVDRDSGERLLTILTSQLNAAEWIPVRYSLSLLAGRTVRLRFVVTNDGSQKSDGLMAMYVDQVSLLACPPGIRPVFPAGITPIATLTATPTPTLAEEQATRPAPVLARTVTPSVTVTTSISSTISLTATVTSPITPTVSSPPSTPTSTPTPTPSATSSATPSLTPSPAATATSSPTATNVPPPLGDPAACDCGADHYQCSDFPSWSAAQACFSHCRSTVGFDVHHLDEDGDDLVCELQLELGAASVLTSSTPSTGPVFSILPLPESSSPLTTSSAASGGPVTGTIPSSAASGTDGEQTGDAQSRSTEPNTTAQSSQAPDGSAASGVVDAVGDRIVALGISPLWLLVCVLFLIVLLLVGVLVAMLVRARRSRVVKAQFQNAQPQPAQAHAEPVAEDGRQVGAPPH